MRARRKVPRFPTNERGRVRRPIRQHPKAARAWARHERLLARQREWLHSILNDMERNIRNAWPQRYAADQMYQTRAGEMVPAIVGIDFSDGTPSRTVITHFPPQDT